MEEAYVTTEQLRKGVMEFVNKEMLQKMGNSLETKFGKFPIAMLAINAAIGTLVGRLVSYSDQIKAMKLMCDCEIVKDGEIEINEFCENLKFNYELCPEMFCAEFYMFGKSYSYHFTDKDVDKLKEYILNAK